MREDAAEPLCWRWLQTVLCFCILQSPPVLIFLSGLSPRQQSLDVVQLHKCLARRSAEAIGGIHSQPAESFVPARSLGGILQVRQGKANLAFLMNACPVQKVRDVALAGEVMPQKSTDFYPKLLSGLTAYALD